jgi:hypothetical protein
MLEASDFAVRVVVILGFGRSYSNKHQGHDDD